jgi:hypothetical protein
MKLIKTITKKNHDYWCNCVFIVGNKRIKYLVIEDGTHYDNETYEHIPILKEVVENQLNERLKLLIKFVEDNQDWIVALPKGRLHINNIQNKYSITLQIRNKKHANLLSKNDLLHIYSKHNQHYDYNAKMFLPPSIFKIELGDIVETYSAVEIDNVIEDLKSKNAIIDEWLVRKLEWFKSYWSGRKLLCVSMERRGYTEPSYVTVRDWKNYKSEWINFSQDSRKFEIPVWNEDGGTDMEKWFIKRKLKNIFDI